MKFARAWELVKDTVKAWSEDNVPRLGAALAFYTLLSLAPLLVVATAIAGLTFGEQAARGQLVAQIKDSVGPEGAAAIQTMLANAYHPAAGIWATVLSGVVLLVGATGLFAGMRPQQRVEVLLTFLGSQRSAVLQASAVERVGG